MFLWGVPLLAVGGIALAFWRPLEVYEWIGLALLSAVGGGGGVSHVRRSSRGSELSREGHEFLE